MSVPELESAAFPTLSPEQMKKLGQCSAAKPRSFRDGEVLFSVGDSNFKFFVVMSGRVDIIDKSSGEPKVLTSHGPGQFTGDVSHLTGTRAIVSAVARGECQVYEITSDSLKRVLGECPTLSDTILRAFMARRRLLRDSADFTGLRVIGSRYSTDTFRVREFLAKNRILFHWVDIETDPEWDRLLKQFGLTEAQTPVVTCGKQVLLRNPSNRELADAVGIHQPLEQELYDLAIVGGGPAGLAAAVYGASEGLRTVVLERTAPGGQAGTSMRIENYLGFPTGITGSELADRAVLQANKFGARLSVPSNLTALTFDKAYPVLHLETGETATTKCLLIATGADYRKLTVEGCAQYEGAGVYYAATPNEVPLCKDCTAVVVGGGNSAGQAVVYLAGYAKKVILILRGADLYKNMSSYLARRIEHTHNVELVRNSAITHMCGDGHLAKIHVVNTQSKQERDIETPTVFSFIGAVPRTDWLPAEIEKDDKGFVKTGPSLVDSPSWPLRRQPFLLETSRPGVFAAGDVRSGSVKRCASAVGEGSMAVQFVHEYLKQM